METIASVSRQTGLGGRRIRIIVADNDETPSARERVEQAFADLKVNGLYLHAPSRNISIARNACLDAATAPLAAFIDDDELAHPGWLATLIARQAAGADMVFGEVRAVYPAGSPDWAVRADMHSTRAVVRGGVVSTGYSGNVLMRMAALGGLRFDLAHGLTGGEDTQFFAELHRRGVKLAYAEDAKIDEPVPEARVSLRWLMRRAYRFGQTHAAVKRRAGANIAAVAATALLKLIVCAAGAVLTVWSATRWRRWAVRGALHAGVIGAAFGRRTLELYGGKGG